VKTNIQAIFIKVLDQIELKNGRNDELLNALDELKSQQLKYDVFVSLMQKLLAGVPLEPDEEDSDISGSEIEQAVQRIQAKVEKDLKAKEAKIRI
jgi:hypothetical protein